MAATKKVKSGTCIKPCVCKHEYQDKRYGPGLRLHNFCAKGARCTVCGTEKLE